MFVLFLPFSQLIVSDQIDTLFRYQKWLKYRLSFVTALALVGNIVASITVAQTVIAPSRLNSKDKGTSKTTEHAGRTLTTFSGFLWENHVMYLGSPCSLDMSCHS